MPEHTAMDKLTQKTTVGKPLAPVGVFKNACAFPIVCYNCETPHNFLSIKGLPVIRTRLFRTVRLICLLAAVTSVGIPAESFAAVRKATTASTSQTAAKTPTTAKKKLTLKKTSSRSRVAARAATATRAKAALAARQMQEAQQPRFKLDDTGALVPDVRAEAAIIYNPATGKVLWESNSQNQRSIASITKVMTAVVFLETAPDLSQPVVIDPIDVRNASTTYLRAGYTVTKDDLLHLMLIASDNGAAKAIARISSYGYDPFIRRMTEKARELGLSNTTYADPSGLLATNVSSAYDMARLITYVSGDDRIASIMRTPYYTVNAGRHAIQIHSTNQLVMKGDVDVQAGKTGFISKAGYCLATLLRLPQGGPQVAVVVLGAKSNPGRFMETRHLYNWMSTKAAELIGAPVAAATAVAVTGAAN
jgi:D-alanyl-D-alanine endopeptidase (penicillin-binding protein 7)